MSAAFSCFKADLSEMIKAGAKERKTSSKPTITSMVPTSYRFLSWMSGLPARWPKSTAKAQDVADTSGPAFPEDVERAINEVLLNDTREMCSTMSLVASRFQAWTKPIMFHAVIVRPRRNWLQRISQSLLPNADLIHILVLDLPFTERGSRYPRLSDKESSHIRRLLQASQRVRRLAVTWNIWAEFERECGALQLESLYLIWDRIDGSDRPSLNHLQHPSALQDLTVYAPYRLRSPQDHWRPGVLCLPQMTHCVNIAYVTYATDLWSEALRTVGELYLKRTIFILVDMYKDIYAPPYDGLIARLRERNPNFSTAYLRFYSQVLLEWVAKMEGLPSILRRPPPE
ncbi:hypothetical protein DFH07DRAFT_1016892 [Mycena maculata]|uniref:Uncharacterized protein n=1 Tax=Mycena maculata TaxID=230809 RepID=A0AAD7MF20_9AGAR|nr:hypothetical protein DFH07DRAFT_1016892 [Mycena maculata]